MELLLENIVEERRRRRRKRIVVLVCIALTFNWKCVEI
jgi:hypothetical protein